MAKVLLFGPLADVLGTEVVNTEIPAEVKTVNDLVELLRQRGKDWQRYLSAPNLQVTVNRQFCELNHAVSNSDEIALIPRPGTV